MNPKVEEFILSSVRSRNEKTSSHNAAAKAEIAEKLRLRGYYEKEYMPSGGSSADYPHLDPDGVRRYRKRCIELSDEEFEALKEYFPSSDPADAGGLLYAAAGIEAAVSVALSLIGTSYDFPWLFVGLPLAVLTWAAGRISRQLSQIKEKQDNR